MAKVLTNFCIGAGSVLELYPSRRHFEFGAYILGQSNSDAIHGDWLDVGGEIGQAYHKVGLFGAPTEHLTTRGK